jgi:hypothetical protein
MSVHEPRIKSTLLPSFDRLSFKEWWARVVSGLRQPRTSGRYRWATLQIKRLLSPVSAVILPVLVVLLLCLLAGPRHLVEDSVDIAVLPQPVPPPPLDEIPEPVETELHEPIVFSPVPTLTESECSPIESLQPQPSDVQELNALPVKGVIQTRCPVVLPRIYKRRAAASEGDAADSGSGATASTEASVMNALRWLKSVQEPDGSWTLASGAAVGARSDSGAAPAMTGLALLAYLAHGETPNSAEFGYVVEKGLKWLQSAQQPDGHFRGRDSHDYSHPIVAFALCEAYGMTRNPLLTSVAQRAVKVIVEGQNPLGGWTYNCKPDARNDLSYTGWCVQAIKAAKLAGISCEGLDAALERAEGGLCRNASPSGSFGYTGPTPSPLTGVGVLGLQLLGYKSPGRIARGLAVLDRATCDWEQPIGPNPIYHWYYITQAKRLGGGKCWDLWNRQFAPELTSHQIIMAGASDDGKDLGYWESASAREHCKSRVYNTTLCTLSLEVYYKVGGFEDPPQDAARSEIEDPDDIPLLFIDV